jgi:large subunit ribosomal protein L6
MSRIAKMPVDIPQGVDVTIQADQISVKGTGGTLTIANSSVVNIINDKGQLTFAPANESREANAMSGTMRQLVNNMVVGVTKGFEKKLSLVGIPLNSRHGKTQIEVTHQMKQPWQSLIQF